MLVKLFDRLIARRHALIRYATSTASLVAGVVAHSVAFIILARSLGAAQFGQLAIIQSAMAFGMVWCGLGSGEMLRRIVARDFNAYPQALGHVIVINLTTGLLICAILIPSISMFVKLSDNFYSNIIIVALYVTSNLFLYAIITLTEIIFLTHEKITAANIVNFGAGVGRAITAFVACFGFGVVTLETWAYWHFGFYLVAAIACAIAVSPFGRPVFCIKRDELFRGASVSMAGLMLVLRQNADVLALGAVAPLATVGIYSVARRLVSTASVVSASLDRLVYSSLAVAGKSGPMATYKLGLKYSGYAVILCSAASLSLFFLAPYVPLIFGERYSAAIPTLQILSWTLILISLQWLASDALNAAEQHKIRLIAETTAGLIGTGVLVLLTLAYGLNGILTAVYVSGVLVAAALWGTLYWAAHRQSASEQSAPPLPASTLGAK